ncbi:MAG: glycine cleavage system aminomethyltransferase GcvT [Alphaproteobacteria bacterium]|nr:glycine cleavage system aminomethyltransferase GcvT [Alphaproteobacteria bacterium]MDE2336919.1 glycine cleavage system aminomethyltransferase GcvT [Alphaproteobacteria bacterium]
MTNAAHHQPAETPALLKTPLWELHKALGGKMVPFAGYDMPVQYDGMGVLKEHLHTRRRAGLFDVSHMGQALLTAKEDPALALEKIVPGSMTGLEPEKQRYTLLLNDKGGILDDLMVTRWDDKTLFLVVNAACKEKDFNYIRKTIGKDVKLDYLADRALLALQGPEAEKVLARLFPLVAAMKFMTTTKVVYEGAELFISRSGYTGEDGFEISVPAAMAERFAKQLLEHEEVKMIGLGARDSLRLEAGLCLYGHELDETVTPVEANLKWVIQKRRREEGGFCGADRILAQLKDGTQRLRVGIRPEGKAPVREGTEILSPEGQVIGMITSGGFGPSVDHPVAMGYVESAYAAEGTQLQAMLRGTARPCAVAALPFIAPNYKRD